MKMEVHHPKFFDIFRKYDGFKKGELKLKHPNQLQEVLDIARDLLYELRNPRSVDDSCDDSREGIEEHESKLETIKMVLEMHGHFNGINRKVQFKYQSNEGLAKSSNSDGRKRFRPSLLLILKWGGELTPAGRKQAEELGKAFRCLYPGGDSSDGLGFLRLHSTYRHDLKIYASDEGRVRMTAAAFAKGLLALEGELTPILVHMVKSADPNGLLDNESKEARIQQHAAKKVLQSRLQQDKWLDDEDAKQLNPLGEKSIQEALDFVANPFCMCDRIWATITLLLSNIRRKLAKSRDQYLYLSEKLELGEKRWAKLLKDFRHVTHGGEIVWNISKIPDIYDSAKYDLEHNSAFLQFDQLDELYIASKYLADIVVPSEYGIRKEEKLMIAEGICAPLMRKLRADLQLCVSRDEDMDDVGFRLDPSASEGITRPGQHVRTRLYFTSESHIHSLMNMLRYGNLKPPHAIDKQWQRAMRFLSSVAEYNYMTQLVIMLYEDPNKELTSEKRFHVELHFSPGALPCVPTDIVPGLGYRPKPTTAVTSISSTDRAPLTTHLQLLCAVKGDEQCNHQLDAPTDDSPSPSEYVSISNQVSFHFGDKEEVKVNKLTDLTELSELSELNEEGSSTDEESACSVGIVSVGGEKEIRHKQQKRLHRQDTSFFGSNTYNRVVKPYNNALLNWKSQKIRNQLPGISGTAADLLKHVATDQFISTAVISGNPANDGQGADPALMSTFVLERGSSMPDLSVVRSSENIAQSCAKISDFVPPIRSLETLHNQLSHKQVDAWLGISSTNPTQTRSDISENDYLARAMTRH